MFKLKLNTILISISATLPLSAQALEGISGKFDVDFGPIPLGEVIMQSSCNETTCKYDTQVNGSFLMIGADIHETGEYGLDDELLMPVVTSYIEKVGSKRREYLYDFSSMTIEDKKKKKIIELPESTFSFVPLLNQVALDAKNGALKKTYDYLSKHRARQAKISSYMRRPAKDKNGTMHSFVATRKDSSVKIIFRQKGDNMFLEGMEFGAFSLSPQKK